MYTENDNIKNNTENNTPEIDNIENNPENERTKFDVQKNDNVYYNTPETDNINNTVNSTNTVDTTSDDDTHTTPNPHIKFKSAKRITPEDGWVNRSEFDPGSSINPEAGLHGPNSKFKGYAYSGSYIIDDPRIIGIFIKGVSTFFIGFGILFLLLNLLLFSIIGALMGVAFIAVGIYVRKSSKLNGKHNDKNKIE